MPSWPSLSFSLTTLVLAFCLAINIALIRQDYSFVKEVRTVSGTRRLPYPDELPITVEPVVLETARDSHYGMSADSDWASLFPEGFSLDPIANASLLSQDVVSKVPSLYNQLFCLNRLRKIFMNPGWEDDKCKDRQVHRCLNLLRQGLLCNGDTALEPTITVEHEGAKETGASGYEVKHVCQDWTKVREATEQRLSSRK